MEIDTRLAKVTTALQDTTHGTAVVFHCVSGQTRSAVACVCTGKRSDTPSLPLYTRIHHTPYYQWQQQSAHTSLSHKFWFGLGANRVRWQSGTIKRDPWFAYYGARLNETQLDKGLRYKHDGLCSLHRAPSCREGVLLPVLDHLDIRSGTLDSVATPEESKTNPTTHTTILNNTCK